MRFAAIFFAIFLNWSNAFCQTPIEEDVNPELVQKYSQFLEVAAFVIDSDLVDPTRLSNVSKADRDLVYDIFNRSSATTFYKKEIFERIYQDFHYLKDFSKFEFAPDIETQKKYLKTYASFVKNLHWILSELIKDNDTKSTLSDLSDISSKSIRLSDENWNHIKNPLARSKLIQIHNILDRNKSDFNRSIARTTTLFALLPLMLSVLNTSPITAPGADLLISSGYFIFIGAAIIAGYAFAKKIFAQMGKMSIGPKDLQKQNLEIKPELDKLQRGIIEFKDFLDRTKSCKTSTK